MIKSFSVARPGGTASQPRLPIRRELAEHISQLAARYAVPDFEPRTVERQTAELPEPWWRSMRREKAVEYFRRAVAGGFPDRLPLDSVVALAGLTAEGVADKPTIDKIRERLSGLLEVGLLRQDGDGLISRESVRSAWDDLGLPDRGALAFWSGEAAVGEAVQQKPKIKNTKSDKGAEKLRSGADELLKRCPEWLKEKLRPLAFLDCVMEGAKALRKTLQVGDADLSASVVVAALKKLGVIPLNQSEKTMQDAIRAYFHHVEWRSRAKATACPDAVSELAECFLEGQRIAKGLADETANLRRQNIRATS
jgi:hypothetical protein